MGSKPEIKEIKPVASHDTARPDGTDITPADNKTLTDRRKNDQTAPGLPGLSIDSVEYAKANFYRMDGNGDGFVSSDELDGYIRANKKNFKEDEQQVVDNLKAHMHKLETAHEDESNWGDDNDGMTGLDLVEALDACGSANAKGQYKFGEKPADTIVASTNPEETCDPEASDCEPEVNETPTKPEEEEITYEVKPNDSLWKILREDLRQRNNGKEQSYKDILHEIDAVAAANGIERDAIIHPGQKLKLRGCPEQPTRPVEPAHPAPVEPGPPRRETPVETPRPTVVPRPEPENEERRDNPACRQERKPEPAMSSTDVLRKHFGNIDTDGNNRVSEREIRQYLYDFGPEISDKDKVALNRIARQAGKIQELSNDEKGDENSGISARDLQKVDEMQEAARIMQKSGMWSDFNTDGDKYLKKGEIETASRRAHLSEKERRALNYMYDNYGKFQEGNNDEKGDENSGITWNDLRWYANFV